MPHRHLFAGPVESAAFTFHPARSIARVTTGSRALPASIAVSESSLGGFVGLYPVAEYQRARRQPRADEARTSMLAVVVEPCSRTGEYLRPVNRRQSSSSLASFRLSCRWEGGAIPVKETAPPLFRIRKPGQFRRPVSLPFRLTLRLLLLPLLASPSDGP